MQKSTKRLLSMLAVLALVLTMAPAGILAVETKAESTLPEGVQQKIDEARAIQNAALALTAESTTCPCHPGETVTWLPLPTTTGARPAMGSGHSHYYIAGEYANATGNAVLTNDLGSTDALCLLLIDADAMINNRFLFFLNGACTVNIMGKGKIATESKNTNGLLTVNGAAAGTVNLYGGEFVGTGNTTLAKALLYIGNTAATVNIWNDVKIGNADKPTDTSAASYNVYISGTLNMYGGTIRNGKYNVNDASYPKYKPGNISLSGSGKFNMYGGSVENGYGSRGANIYMNDKSVVHIYGGEIKDGYAAEAGGNIYMDKTGAKLYIHGGKITGGKTAASKSGGNIYTTGVLEIKGGEISGGEAGSQGGNIWYTGASLSITGGTIKDGVAKGDTGGNIYMNTAAATEPTTISNATIIDGNAKVSHGGNIFTNGGSFVLEASNTISGGKASGKTVGSCGGNVYVYGATMTIKCDLTGGHANMAGNFAVTGGATVILDGATISGGTIDADSQIQYNGRVDAGTLILKNDVNCVGGIMFVVEATSVLKVDETFNGDVTIWQNGTTYAPGDPVRNFTCEAEFPGIVRNGNAKVAAAENDLKDVYIACAMVWDGASGLKCPAQGLVYNGTLTYAANSQAAVNAYIAAMADENVTAKPQYVYVTESVELKDGAEVVIWPGADITVSGKGTVYGVDRKNDNYAAHGASITVEGEVTVAPEVTAGGRRYIALSDATVDANKYTFHRVETKLTNVTVNVANAGIYYKAEYQFDEIVKDRIASYGVNVNLEGSTKEGQTSSSDMSIYDAESHTLTAKSHGVYGIFKDTNLASTNKENGQIKLCGNPYLAIDTTGNMESSDCPEFTAAESTKMSLADAMEMANEKWEAINEEGKPMLKEFFTKWLEAGAWDAEWAAKLTNLLPAEA